MMYMDSGTGLGSWECGECSEFRGLSYRLSDANTDQGKQLSGDFFLSASILWSA